MEDAWMSNGRGSYVPVTAIEMQRMYHGYVPSGVRFVCPICRQPLIPAAMSRSSLQSPHFRHQSNNQTAQQCERFSRGDGGYVTASSQRMPLPLFIRRRFSGSRTFVVEGGFRSPDQDMLDMLSSAHATLRVCSREYSVDARRFNGGMIRIPFDEMYLRLSNAVSLEDSPLPIRSIWGLPEDAVRMMVFTRDEHTGQGRRVRRGESIEYGTPVYLLLPKMGMGTVTKAFESCKHEGSVECALGAQTLQVLSSSVPDKMAIRGGIVSVLSNEGISLCEKKTTLDVVWPPSLLADGEVHHLLKSPRSVFSVGGGKIDTGGLFTHRGTALTDDVEIIPVQMPHGKGGQFVAVDAVRGNLVITTSRDDYSTSVLVGHTHLPSIETLPDYTRGFEVLENVGRSEMAVSLSRKLEVAWLRRGLPDETYSDSGKSLKIDMHQGDVVRISKRLNARVGVIGLWQESCDAMSRPKVSARDTGNSVTSSLKLSSRDVEFAALRRDGRKMIGLNAREVKTARARRNA